MLGSAADLSVLDFLLYLVIVNSGWTLCVTVCSTNLRRTDIISVHFHSSFLLIIDQSGLEFDVNLPERSL